MNKHLKKVITLFLLSLFFVSKTNWYYLPETNLTSTSVINQYNKLDKLIKDNYWIKIDNFSAENKNLFSTRVNEIRDLFIRLDNNVLAKNKQEVWYIFTDIKNHIKDLIFFLKNIKITQIIQNTNQKLNEFAKSWNTWKLTYYADFFEWRWTSNWDKFSHKYFSAAKCDIPLDTMIQIWSWNRSLLVKANDRPDCKRFPWIVDLTKTAYDILQKNNPVRQAEYVVLWKVYDDYYKMYLPNDYFSTANISLQWNIANTYLVSQSIHINWFSSNWSREVELNITTPSGKNISLKKDVEKYFSFSYPLDEPWIYHISFWANSPKFKIYSLDDKAFAGKKFIEDTSIEKLNEVKIVKDPLGKWINSYRLVLKWDNYNMINFSINWKQYFYSWVGDVIIPENVFLNYDTNNWFDITIKSAKTITGFSHDFYTEPVLIYSGKVKISE